MDEPTRPGLGWLPDYPDVRDYTPDQDSIPERQKERGQDRSVKAMLTKVGVAKPLKAVPAATDLRAWCPPIEDQGALGSCTAQAAVALVEYFERRAFGRHIDGSRLFVYKATRNLMKVTGDTGAFMRTSMGSLVLFGVPPEEHYPYKIADFDKEPPAFLYSFAQNYKALSYYRLDPPNANPADVLARIKTNLTVGLPSMFGFTVYNSIWGANATGEIPYPAANDSVAGGHAIVAVGYDDNKEITNPGDGSKKKGAFLIRNSWGTSWGQAGYGWLPYAYLMDGLADDWWSMLKSSWVDSGKFQV